MQIISCKYTQRWSFATNHETVSTPAAKVWDAALHHGKSILIRWTEQKSQYSIDTLCGEVTTVLLSGMFRCRCAVMSDASAWGQMQVASSRSLLRLAEHVAETLSMVVARCTVHGSTPRCQNQAACPDAPCTWASSRSCGACLGCVFWAKGWSRFTARPKLLQEHPKNWFWSQSAGSSSS